MLYTWRTRICCAYGEGDRVESMAMIDGVVIGNHLDSMISKKKKKLCWSAVDNCIFLIWQQRAIDTRIINADALYIVLIAVDHSSISFIRDIAVELTGWYWFNTIFFSLCNYILLIFAATVIKSQCIFAEIPGCFGIIANNVRRQIPHQNRNTTNTIPPIFALSNKKIKKKILSLRIVISHIYRLPDLNLQLSLLFPFHSNDNTFPPRGCPRVSQGSTIIHRARLKISRRDGILKAAIFAAAVRKISASRWRKPRETMPFAREQCRICPGRTWPPI